MKKGLKGSIITILVAFLALLGYNGVQQQFGGLVSDSFNAVTHTATTTHASLPVKLLDYNGDRKWVQIKNDSNTDIYIYLGYFADASAASTTVGINEGIKLSKVYVGSFDTPFEINQDNMYLGQVWATSTTSGKNILITENN